MSGASYFCTFLNVGGFSNDSVTLAPVLKCLVLVTMVTDRLNPEYSTVWSVQAFPLSWY